MTWIVVKQYFLTGSQDEVVTKQQFWSQLSGSGDTQTFRLTTKRNGKS